MSLARAKKIYTTIIEKIETENSFLNLEKSIYSFHVSKDSTKHDIRLAFKTLYPGVTVNSINTLIRKGKVKRHKRGFSRKVNRKIAMINCSGDVGCLLDLKVADSKEQGEANVTS